MIHDAEARQLFFSNAQIRISGVPVFYLPRLRLPDPTLERARGFLIPRFRTSSDLGTGIKLPYFASILVATVSTQALLIYLSHPLILNQLNGAFGASLPVLLKIIITVAFGIVLGRICRPFFGVLGVNQLAQQRFLFRKTGTKFAARQN